MASCPRLRPTTALLAGCSTCGHDSAASILNFKPRLANRCRQKVKTRAIRASILNFKPRLANQCSHKVKTGAIRASILDFRPRLANRCSQKVKAGAIRALILDFRPRIGNHCSKEGINGQKPCSTSSARVPSRVDDASRHRQFASTQVRQWRQKRVLMRPEAAFPYVFAAEGAQHPPIGRHAQRAPQTTTAAKTFRRRGNTIIPRDRADRDGGEP